MQVGVGVGVGVVPGGVGVWVGVWPGVGVGVGVAQTGRLGVATMGGPLEADVDGEGDGAVGAVHSVPGK